MQKLPTGVALPAQTWQTLLGQHNAAIRFTIDGVGRLVFYETFLVV